MAIKKTALFFILTGLLLFAATGARADNTDKGSTDRGKTDKGNMSDLIADDIMYTTAMSASESLVDFAAAADKGIVKLPFASTKVNRGSVDYRVHWDASSTIEYILDVENLKPEIPFSTPVFYLKSGDGWYSIPGIKETLGTPNTLRFHYELKKTRTEGTPTGLDKIDGIRIAVYPVERTDSSVRLVGIRTPKPSMLIVDFPVASGKNTFVSDLVRMLKAERIACVAVAPEKLTAEMLDAAPVVMLPYQEKVAPQTVELLIGYMKRGGFLISAYNAPRSLMQAMGFGPQRFVRAKKTGQDFKEMRFESDTLKSYGGLMPDVVTQDSHNIQSSMPEAAETITDPYLREASNAPRVMAWWYDADGVKTEHAAMLASGYGINISHVLYTSWPEGKQRFLRAVCLKRDPGFRKETVLKKWRELFDVGRRFDDEPAKANSLALSTVTRALETRGWSRKQVREQLCGGESQTRFADCARFLAALDEIKTERIAEVCRGIGSKNVEARLWWEHSGTGAYPGDWDRTCRELAAAHFNGIVVNMLWGGTAHYDSKYLPPHRNFTRYGDQVAQAAAACKKYGLELHIWKVNFNMLNAPRDFVDKMRREGRTQVSLSGEEKDWLCPSHPLNRQLETDVMLEVATKYDITGIHFDYIRYDGDQYCFCKGCQERFAGYYSRKYGKELGDLVTAYKKDEAVRTAFAAWKADQVSAVVRGVKERVRKECPKIKISAAVFRDYPSCRDIFGQDWVKWVKSGWLDFVCPMDYTMDNAVFARWVKTQNEMIGGAVPLYPGIGLWSSGSRQTADQTAVQIEMTRQLGAQGYTIFSLNKTTIEQVGDLLKQGPNKLKATMPHSK